MKKVFCIVIMLAAGVLLCSCTQTDTAAAAAAEVATETAAETVETIPDIAEAVVTEDAEVEETEASSEETEENTVQKEYVNINNFKIEGKWKNVGTNTFGQAQKGAIVVFNGTNCNLFSPVDTYGFYKKGEDYLLDCTSPFGDTVSFKVKLIDKDHIDIYYSSDCIEMTRVG